MTVYVQDADFTLHHGDVLDVLDADPVEILPAKVDGLHLLADIGGSRSRTDMASAPRNSRNLALFLDRSQRKTVLSLRPLDTQVGQKRSESSGGLLIGLTPAPKRPSALGARIGYADIAAERCREKIKRTPLNLPDVDALGVRRLTGISDDSHGVRVALDTDRAVRIKDASEVCERDFVHTTKYTQWR